MSQHMFRTVDLGGKPVRVVLGFDRRLDYVFCFVEDEEEDFLYSNLDDDQAGIHQQDVSYYRLILAGLGIIVPDQMFTEVESDQANRVGNREVDYTK